MGKEGEWGWGNRRGNTTGNAGQVMNATAMSNQQRLSQPQNQKINEPGAVWQVWGMWCVGVVVGTERGGSQRWVGARKVAGRHRVEA